MSAGEAIGPAVLREFEARFGGGPTWVARAPGRVNLIGEHTDYNDGFVLPMAIDREVRIALRPRADRRVVLHSLDFGETRTVELDAMVRSGEDWIEYVQGVAWALHKKTRLCGWEGVTAGDVPIGAGLSSSAALELAAARAFSAVCGFEWEAREMALTAQRAENAWVGVNCGIMDQMISAAGEAGHALLIDCRSLRTSPVPLPPGTAVVILDTATRRGLVDSAYNERRGMCEAAAGFFRVPALRDVSVAAFQARAAEMDPVMRRRARHVVTEIDRTLRAARALEAGDAAEVGRLMDESHASLRDDFEVSRGELDAIVGIAREHPACHGARMTGAGFGGCAVALVRADAADDFAATVAQRYDAATGLRARVYVCAASQGATVEVVASHPAAV
ncbi:MAG: Galactokinase [Gemmatimonadetes bacterium]|nr:Galactokinase [Gemmatimonadota bacterium]